MADAIGTINDGQPKAKRERTPKQKEAFERMLAAREEAILAKHRKAAEPEKPPAPPSPVTEGQHEDSASEQASEPASEQEEPRPEPPAVQQEDDAEYYDFDPESVYEKLSAHQAEVKALKEQMAALSGRHEELHSDFRTHGVRVANGINFV